MAFVNKRIFRFHSFFIFSLFYYFIFVASSKVGKLTRKKVIWLKKIVLSLSVPTMPSVASLPRWAPTHLSPRVVLTRRRWVSPVQSPRRQRQWRLDRVRRLADRRVQRRTRLEREAAVDLRPAATVLAAMSCRIFPSSAPTFSQLSTSNNRIFTSRTCSWCSHAWLRWRAITSTSRRQVSAQVFATTELPALN